MRIAMLSWETLYSPCVGGVGRHVSEMAAALARAGHDVHVFSRVAPGQTYHQVIDGVHYQRCPYLTLPDFVDDVNSMCRAFVERLFVVEDMTRPFDVVHAHDWLAANAMIWIKQGRGRPSVFTVHSTEYARCGNAFPPGRSERIRVQERAGTYWAERVIGVSNAVRSEIAWMYEVPAWKISVINNGVTPARFERHVDGAATRRRYSIGTTDPTIVFSGRLEWQKGPDLLLEAMPTVLLAHPNAKLIYVGDGSMRPGIENRAWQLGIAHAVRFLGRRDEAEIAALYRISDVVCIPSRNEPFGIVVIEAWSAGKPVIVTDQGGAHEIVRHEHDGLHVSPTPDSIAWGIKNIFADTERARRMGANGHRECVLHYAWPTIANQTAEVYAIACGAWVEPVAGPGPVAPSLDIAKEVAHQVTRQAHGKVTKNVRADGTPARKRGLPAHLNT